MGRSSYGKGDVLITLVISPEQLRGDDVLVDGHAYRHLFRARRLAAGAEVRLVDGDGEARFAKAVDVKPSSARLVLDEKAPSNEPRGYVVLLAPIPKASRLSWMVEKATEIGVSGIRLVRTERAPRKLGVGTLDRLRRVAVAAVEQSHRSVVPFISGSHPFSDLPDLMKPISERWFLQPEVDSSPPSSSGSTALLVVGPEGGWTVNELDRLKDWSCRPMCLGPTVLRIETAAAVGCAALLIGNHSS